MAFTLGEATKATGVSKTSLHRAIKSGRISATKLDNGSYEIDPSELFRVFPPAAERNIGISSSNPSLVRDGTGETSHETGALRREIELLREERERERRQLEAQVEDLRRRLDQAEQERRQLSTRLLTDQRPKPEPESEPPEPEPPRRWRWWRIGRAAKGS